MEKTGYTRGIGRGASLRSEIRLKEALVPRALSLPGPTGFTAIAELPSKPDPQFPGYSEAGWDGPIDY